jgi:rRNA-processing protein FCF1
MAALPPFLLVFDISALISSGEREWREFSRIGDCFVPRAVLEEIQHLCDRATETSQEQVAREFSRFFPVGGWKSTLSIATHPALKPAEGHELSKRARLALTVAQTAYGLARNRSDALVVLVANDQGLMQRIRGLGVANLSTIPLVALVQWGRTGRKPPVVTHQLQAMRTTTSTTVPATVGKPPRAVASPPAKPITTPSPAVRRSTRPALRIPIASIFFNLLTVAMVGAVAALFWHLLFPHSFAKFWNQLPFTESAPIKVSPRRK